MTAPRGSARWRVALFALVGLAALLPVGVTRWARAHYARTLAARTAVATAGYLTVVTPLARTGAGYDLAQLFIRARALDQVSSLHGRLEIYHGGAPLLHATGLALAPGTIEALRRQTAVRWSGTAALAPLFDPAGWDVVGAVEARASLPDGPLVAWMAGAVALALVTGLAAGRALGDPAAEAQRTARRYAAAAGLLGLFAGIDLHAAARDATNRSLTDTRLLLEEAAAHLRDAHFGPTSLAAIAGDAELVAGDSAGRDARRVAVAGLARATVAVRLGPGHWAALRRAPEEEGIDGWLLGTFALALLGPLGVATVTWATRAAARPRAFRETVAAWGFLTPSALHLVVCSFGPIAFGLYVSLHHWGLLDPARRFVGLANYVQVVRDPLVWTALRNTLVYALYVPVSMTLALVLALALQGPSWGARVLRTAVFAPSVASVVAVALVWQAMYRAEGGGVNRLLSLAGIGPVDWLGDPATALVALMLVSVWVQVGSQMTVFLAGLARIPRTLLDAARVDGANRWQRFWRVTFPLLGPVRRFVLVTGVIGAIQLFTLVYVLTAGGPLHATDVVAYRIYETAWELRQFGGASALALLQFALVGGLAWAELRRFARGGADA
ncbi:MAG TPA: sugar ABC transporter permease [Gemmatimonadales bacterium]|nr:sugar ABC transporter permease [Gemmatimonadales bacterium]